MVWDIIMHDQFTKYKYSYIPELPIACPVFAVRPFFRSVNRFGWTRHSRPTNGGPAPFFFVGAILFQILTKPDGSVENQPIAFCSERFSGPAQKWDTDKREAYAIYHSVPCFAWYLRGKEFLVETDHRNLQWIESS